MEETAGRPDAVSVNVVPVTTGKDTGVAERFANLMPYTILIVLIFDAFWNASFPETDKSGQRRTKADKFFAFELHRCLISVVFWSSSFSKADKSGVSDLPRPSCPQARWLGPTA